MRVLKALAAAAALALAPASGSAAPALWSVADEDTTIYLFGTVHVLPEGLDWRSEALDTVFASADTLCIETDIIANGASLMWLTMDEGVFKDARRLSDYLSEADLAELREVAAELSVPFASLDVMKPWNAMFTLSSAFAVKFGFRDTLGVEVVLYERAAAQGKAICEMETPFEHIMSIGRLPLPVQVEVMTYKDPEDMGKTVAELMEEGRAEMDEMIASWASGDFEALVDAKETYGHPDFYDAILTNRNAAWVLRIEEMLAEPGTVFIAVGAAHLAGPDSVQAMLEARGYTVAGPRAPSGGWGVARETGEPEPAALPLAAE